MRTKSLKPHWIASWTSFIVGVASVVCALAVVLPRAYETDRTNGVGYTTGVEAALLFGGGFLALVGAVYCLVNLIRWSNTECCRHLDRG